MVAASGCLFHGVQGSCAKCEGTFAAFFSHVVSSLASVDHHQWCASSDQSLGPMLMWAHPGLSYVLSLYVFITSCVCMMHDVCVVLGSSLVFLAFFLLYVDRKKKKGLSYLFYHNIH